MCASNVNKEMRKTKLQKWEGFTNWLKKPLHNLLKGTARFSTRNPCITIVSTILISFGLIVAGFFTNFYLETDNAILWSPSGSITAEHAIWAGTPELSGYPIAARRIVVMLHSNGNDVLNLKSMDRAFDLMETIQNMEGYKELCVETTDGQESVKCKIESPTGFWENHNRTLYEESVTTDKELKQALSSFNYADGKLVNRNLVIGDALPELTANNLNLFFATESFGNPDMDINDLDTQKELLIKAAERFELESAESYLIAWDLPNVGPEQAIAEVFELEAAEKILELNEQWEKEGYIIVVTTRGSMAQELVRGILEDIPLMIGAFLIMTLFTMYSLSRWHRVYSQTSLGIGAVFGIFLSIIAGYGLMFCIGIPLTSLTYLFPYAMLGFGLDDTFIIMGSFQRTDRRKDIEERIQVTIDEVGMSIAVSKLTTIVAYFLGSTSAMPGVRWFCLYASPVIIISFIYQMTYFIALIALDDRRQRSNRCDFLVCCTTSKSTAEESEARDRAEAGRRTCGDKIVHGYATILLKPYTKVFVLFLFSGLLSAGGWYASGIKSELDARDLLPTDSYVLDYFNDLEDYGGGGAVNFQFVGVYFRDVDFSDPVIQDHMRNYITDLSRLPYISSPPLTFWLRDFTIWIANNAELEELDFNTQIDEFLKIGQYNDLYAKDIVRDESGTIITSRAFMSFDEVDPYNVAQQTEAFLAQREVTKNQAINEGSADSHFFTFGVVYYGWELWNILPKEVLFTIILGLTSVFLICLVFISHPIAAFILTPTVAATFVEIIAVLRLAGLSMNALTAISVITCLGLVVDYSVHICLAYFEIEDAKTRNERVYRVIVTMGKSVLKGGFTTFLGVLPLSLNSSLGFRTLFVTFIGITTLGVAHGLMFLPVVLSYIGPMPKVDTVSEDSEHDLSLHESNRDLGEIPVVTGRRNSGRVPPQRAFNPDASETSKGSNSDNSTPEIDPREFA